MQFAFAMLAGLTLVGAEPTRHFANVEPWEIRTDRTMGGCFMATEYADGTILRVGIDAKTGRGYFILGNAAWGPIEAGKDYPLGVRFDGESPWIGSARALRIGSRSLLMLYFDRSNFLEEFMRKQGMAVAYGGREVARLSLKATTTATAEMARCQAEMASKPPETEI